MANSLLDGFILNFWGAEAASGKNDQDFNEIKRKMCHLLGVEENESGGWEPALGRQVYCPESYLQMFHDLLGSTVLTSVSAEVEPFFIGPTKTYSTKFGGMNVALVGAEKDQKYYSLTLANPWNFDNNCW
jgi:hypothetical protein